MRVETIHGIPSTMVVQNFYDRQDDSSGAKESHFVLNVTENLLIPPNCTWKKTTLVCEKGIYFVVQVYFNWEESVPQKFAQMGPPS